MSDIRAISNQMHLVLSRMWGCGVNLRLVNRGDQRSPSTQQGGNKKTRDSHGEKEQHRPYDELPQ